VLLKAPSLYDESLRLLVRKGFAVTDTERDWSQPRPFNESAQAAWLIIYRNPQSHWDLYQLAEELIDLEDAFRQWRYRHVTTVERIIGFKPGTGGTNGVPYLRRQLEIPCYLQSCGKSEPIYKITGKIQSRNI
jgi:tryptophan 2,3-dioxygenase